MSSLLDRYALPPDEIERRSLAHIEAILGPALPADPAERTIVRRIVYAGGDPALAPLVRIAPGTVAAALSALRGGCRIVTDVRMVAVALNARRAGQLGCTIVAAIDRVEESSKRLTALRVEPQTSGGVAPVQAESSKRPTACRVEGRRRSSDQAESAMPAVAREINPAAPTARMNDPDRARRLPRSAEAMRLLAADGTLDGSGVVVGNAPTALLALLDLVDAGQCRPAFVVGMPVGFVAAAESKAELMARDLPWLTIEGTRGGSPLAAATLNALLTLATTPTDQPAPSPARHHTTRSPAPDESPEVVIILPAPPALGERPGEGAVLGPGEGAP